MARGGARSSAPGDAKSNRTDMHQPVRVITGQAYGQAQALANAQRQIPLPNDAAVPGPAAPASPGPPPGPSALPGQQPFMRPTERPGEPVTTGLPTGPGPGPEALGVASRPAENNDAIRQQLMAMYQASPNNDVLRLIELHDQGY